MSIPSNNSASTDPMLEALESGYRSCCAAAWQAHWRHREVEFCDASAAAAGIDSHAPVSRLTCLEVPPSMAATGVDSEAAADGGDGGGGDGGGKAGSTPTDKASTWYCEARHLRVNASAVRLGSSDLSIPTPSQKGLWKPRALLLKCALRWAALKAKGRFGMLMRQLLPGALGEEKAPTPEEDVQEEEEEEGKEGKEAGKEEQQEEEAKAASTIVFIGRYSVKNFWLAHYDLLQVASILLHALGPSMAAGNTSKGGHAAQLVFIPPDKANHDWWGPHKPLWQAFSTLPILSYSEWVDAERRRAMAAFRARAASRSDAAKGPPPLLIPVKRAIFALSGQHSVYGRGAIGRGMEKVCAACGPSDAASSSSSSAASSAAARRMGRVSAFYRPFLSVALSYHGLLYLPPPPTSARPSHRGLWISRGKGLGNGYGKTVGRRCLNEEEVLNALHHSEVRVRLTPLELSGMPFVEQLRHFRSVTLLTGMHGAGYANIIFLPVGAVVAELCPLGYCTESYRRLSLRLGVQYMRWTNNIAENARDGYDTIVDTQQFNGLMAKAVKALDKAAGAADE